MLYLATGPAQPEVAASLRAHEIGLMCQPGSNKPRAGWLWAADNGCFSDKWNCARWESWLGLAHPRSGCLFAVVPDVVGDAERTLVAFENHVNIVRRLGYPVAFVLQDGAEQDLDLVPFHEFDCLFIGGSTEFKMSNDAIDYAQEARDRGKWVHVGRVNSWSRFQAWAPYADSCDGTFLAFGPETNYPRLMSWVHRHRANPQLELA